MLLSTILALITAVSALVPLIFGAKKDKRSLYKNEFLLVFFAIATLAATAYQSWKADHDTRVRDLLSIDWEKDLDNPITDVRVSFLYPSGSTVEADVARLAEAQVHHVPQFTS